MGWTGPVQTTCRPVRLPARPHVDDGLADDVAGLRHGRSPCRVARRRSSVPRFPAGFADVAAFGAVATMTACLLPSFSGRPAPLMTGVHFLAVEVHYGYGGDGGGAYPLSGDDSSLLVPRTRAGVDPHAGVPLAVPASVFGALASALRPGDADGAGPDTGTVAGGAVLHSAFPFRVGHLPTSAVALGARHRGGNGGGRRH